MHGSPDTAIADETLTTWTWTDGNLVASALPLAAGAVPQWGGIEQLGYRSVAMYPSGGGMKTYLYRLYAEELALAPYLVVTILDGGGPQFEGIVSEIVQLPDWGAVLAYLNQLLPVANLAQETDRSWG